MDVYAFSPETLFYWLVGFSVWEALFMGVFPKLNQTPTVAEYYRTLPAWVPVTGDFLYSTVIFLVAQGIYRRVNPSARKLAQHAKLATFAGILVATQIVFDVTYATIVRNLPSNTSRYVDFFQRYIREAKFYAVVGDSVYLLAWLLITWALMRYVPMSVAIGILLSMTFFWLVIGY